MQSSDKARQYILKFVQTYRLFESAMLSGMSQLLVLADVVPQARRGRVSRRGQLLAGLHYQVHGSGCVMVAADGAMVDVDFLGDGRASFDEFRLRHFLRSVNIDVDVRESDIVLACRALVVEGLLEEVRDGWFAIEPAPSR